MKRETRPFVVEVRRGSKKQNAPFLPTPQELQPDAGLQRAEERLFSRAPSQPGTAAPRTGRILEPVAETFDAPPVEEPQVSEAPRRGRPPGSKNASPARQANVEGGKAPRGRPRAAAHVRRLELTPDVVDAAFATLTKAAPRAPAAGGSADEGEDGLRDVAGRERDESRRSHSATHELWPDETDAASPDSAPSEPAARRRRLATPEDGQTTDLRRLFKPGERWRGRMLMRALARRQRG